MLPPYDMGTWARTLLDHEYDDDSEYNVDSYSMPVKEVEKELSPKSMKRYAGGGWEVGCSQCGDAPSEFQSLYFWGVYIQWDFKSFYAPMIRHLGILGQR